jgi:hypothetical protein
MTKDQVKSLCESDARLQWWAMVLFAEVCELVGVEQKGGADAETTYRLVRTKAKEFEQLVMDRAVEQSKEQDVGPLPLGERVAKLEVEVRHLKETVG